MGEPSSVLHSLAVPSELPVTTDLPSGATATAATDPPCSMGRPIGEPSAVLQSRAALSGSVSPVTMNFPSGAKATLHTSHACTIGFPRGEPSAVFQSRAVWSSLPVTTDLPSGAKAKHVIAP